MKRLYLVGSAPPQSLPHPEYFMGVLSWNEAQRLLRHCSSGR